MGAVAAGMMPPISLSSSKIEPYRSERPLRELQQAFLDLRFGMFIHFNMATWIENRALDMVRVSSHYKGGFTGSMKIAHMAESFGMRAEVHGMGLENAQLCAAISNNDYYEQIIMNESQMRGLAKLGPLAVVDGMLTVSDRPGIGYDYDFADLDKRAVAKLEVTERQF